MAIMKSALALVFVAALVAPAQASPPVPEPIYAMATPNQFVGALYIDLSGILRSPKVEKPPAWWNYLTPRTKALHDRLGALDRQAEWTTFRYDWLCQCRNIHTLWAQPHIQIDYSSDTAASLTVRVRISGGANSSVRLLLVKQDGWKLDDIIDERGHRYSEALARAIATYDRGRKPLPEDRPQ